MGTYNGSCLILNFTAPGDDYDEGTGDNVFFSIRCKTFCNWVHLVSAKSYNLTYTFTMVDPDNNTLSEKRTVQIGEAHIISGSVDHPLEAGEKVALVLELEQIFNFTATNYLFRVRATDEAGNQGNPSNIAQYCYKCDLDYSRFMMFGIAWSGRQAIIGMFLTIPVMIVAIGILKNIKYIERKEGKEIRKKEDLIDELTDEVKNIDQVKKDQSAGQSI